MMNSADKMQNFLNVYLTQKPRGKSIPPNASLDFLTAEIEKIIQGDLTGFLELCRDTQYDDKVLVYNALKAKALTRSGLTFQTPEGKSIGESMDAVIAFIKDPLHNEEVIKIKARIENSYGTKKPSTVKAKPPVATKEVETKTTEVKKGRKPKSKGDSNSKKVE